MVITAALVAELRQLTDCGLMDCKRALEETQGDLQKAVEALRKKGIAKAASKAGRVATEGAIWIKMTPDAKHAIMLEINCETDFVGKDEQFQRFVEQVGTIALEKRCSDVLEISNLNINGKTVEQLRQELITKLGENILLRRALVLETSTYLGSYVHRNRIGVLVEVDCKEPDVAKDLAMHIAASKPIVITPKDVDAATLAKEREIYWEQAKQSGKSDDVIERMVEGRVKKFLSETSLVEQPFVKTPDVTVGHWLESKGIKVLKFTRFELGEGIEKKTTDFAKEVAAQVEKTQKK